MFMVFGFRCLDEGRIDKTGKSLSHVGAMTPNSMCVSGLMERNRAECLASERAKRAGRWVHCSCKKKNLPKFRAS